MKKKVVKSTKWFSLDNRRPLVACRISGLNLQGQLQNNVSPQNNSSPQKVSSSNVLYSWSVSKTFDELKQFYLTLRQDESLERGRGFLTASFPDGKEGECDVMVLVERREIIEYFLQETLSNLDFEFYSPLAKFISADVHMNIISSAAEVISRALRSIVAKNKLNSRLFRFYSKELLSFVYKMENGIEVLDVDNLRTKESLILWLDVCEEPSLSRICLAPKELYELPREFEDERLANGIFLSDIAEIRKGASTVAFRRCKYNVVPEYCVAIVGSERTLSFQILSSVNDMKRNFFIDMLSLLSLQSLSVGEISARKRRFTRAHATSLPRPIINSIVKADACKITSLLEAGIDVDEETFSPHFGVRIVAKRLQYYPTTRQLVISIPGSLVQPAIIEENENDTEDENEQRTSCSSISSNGGDQNRPSSFFYNQPYIKHMLANDFNRHVDIDDISEVRPGKVSAAVDGTEDLLTVSIVASKSILILPVPSLSVRNNLVRRFQAFLFVHRNYDSFQSDSPQLFQYRHKGVVSIFHSILKEDHSFQPDSNVLEGTENDNVSIENNKARNFVPQINDRIYSHTRQLRSVSILRRSSSSSKGQSSLSDAFDMRAGSFGVY